MAVHVGGHRPAIGQPVVPGRALGFLDFAFEDPVAEFAADRQDPAEESLVHQPAQLDQPGQVELVVHDTCGDLPIPGLAGQVNRFLQGLGGGLLGEDVLAGGNGLGQGGVAHAGHRGVEDDVDRGIVDDPFQIGGVVLHIMQGRQFLELGLIAPHEHRFDVHLGAVLQGDPALVANGKNRTHQVLAVTHPAGDAVHGDTQDASLGHGNSSCKGNIVGMRFPR